MNKILNVIKIILICLFIYLKITFNNNFDYRSFFNNFFLIIFIIYLINSIKDFIKHESIINNKKYLILEIIALLITNLVFIRCLYDKNFIYNDKESFLEIINYFKSLNSPNIDLKYINIFYLNENIIYFNILYICLLIYRKNNIKSNKTKL